MELTTQLRSLVNHSVRVLGNVIERELGKEAFARIEAIRKKMAKLRGIPEAEAIQHLDKVFKELESLKTTERLDIAHSFTLMLELMNACENAYRSHRLALKTDPPHSTGGEHVKAIVYVLTAHPTEARSPENIAIFHQIQLFLMKLLRGSGEDKEIDLGERERDELFHALEVAWRTPIVRSRAPKVKDEAEHIYTLLLRDEVLFSLLGNPDAPFYVRSWVGGDKDGHPGVDEKVFLESLSLSRKKLLQVVHLQIRNVRQTLELFPSASLLKKLGVFEKSLRAVRAISKGDGKRIRTVRAGLRQLRVDYEKELGSTHPELKRLSLMLHTFPALVVPLELRESSDVLMAPSVKGKRIAIERMLDTIEKISGGGDPRWYARGFIISMAQSLEHIQAAAKKQVKAFGAVKIPVIPLFEETTSLNKSAEIMTAMLKEPALKKAVHEHWDGLVEVMVGYSDSAKEAGVISSRLAIARALPKLEQVCEAANTTPVFFHGSGGSIDRGGGSIQDQTAWWPKSALRHYKVTVQGEMVDRSLATPAIAKRQVEAIFESTTEGLKNSHLVAQSDALKAFGEKVAAHYRKRIHDPDFLRLAELATPYSYLSVLRIGSRPTKRAGQLTVSGLRAIPWVLCWTQTRVLFQTWWGIGSAWLEMSDGEKQTLREDFLRQPVFTSYIKALGFTLAKIELPVFRIYLEQSGLEREEISRASTAFKQELKLTLRCYKEICGQEEIMWFRPWLGESITLRSPMIHPLNLLQILAKKEGDVQLLRLTVTGISSGMLTTG